MIEALARWNRWGTARLASGKPRDITGRLKPFLDSRDILALAGPRRAGKTTVMYQVMDELESRGVPREAMLHVNLEEPGFSPDLGLGLLDRLYDSYREEVFPEGRAYLFLDEVQQVPGWERWVRARNETEEIKILVTGSSSALMSRELGTLLTGRHVTFQVRPLDFTEYLRFKSIKPPARPRLVGTPAPIQNALSAYLQWGGFPEVVLANDDRRRVVLLKQYFDDLLFKDVALRHTVRDLPTLRALAVHLLTQTANLVSYQRIANTFGVSLDLARNYSAHLQEAFMVQLLPYYSLKVSERQRHPNKIHAMDLGLRNVVCLTGSPDRGRLAETAVHNALAAEHDDLHYFRKDNELDLLVRRGNKIETVVQVTAEGLDRKEVLKRELAPLVEAEGRFPGARRYLVAGRIPRGGIEVPPGVDLVPLWRALMGELG